MGLFTNHDRISVNPNVMIDKSAIKGIQIPVEQAIDELNGGWTAEAILDARPRLTPGDIQAVLAYAADTASE